MRYLSLFSGIEAATLAWTHMGWEPVAFAQHDPEHDYRRGPDFASAVLAHHHPHVPNLGDVCAIIEERVAALGAIDLVVGGSPCQDLSVAGRRGGLDGARSGLFFEQWRIFDAARRRCGARFLLWENVPGAFSSNAGRDFAVVVGTMAGIDPDELRVSKWGTEGAVVGANGLVEWAVLDAQWYGVAQRRRRVFALLDVGDWANRFPILLEPPRLRGDPPSRGEAQEDASAGARADAGARRDQRSGVIDCTPAGIAGNMSSKWVKGTGGPAGDEHYNLVVTPSFEWPPEVRRLTPLECERLQGFLDGYTLIPFKGKPAADAPRYKALGNSMAVPVMRWIGERIDVALIV